MDVRLKVYILQTGANFIDSDKSNSTTYQLVHRAQNDPLIHDVSSSSMVFQEVAPTQARKTRNRRDLEDELFGNSERSSVISGFDAGGIRENEGEAAEYGVYYDDTEYDYMQHLRDVGSESNVGTSAVWVSADQGKGKQKQKQSLSEALARLDIEHEKDQAEKKGKIVDPSILPSSSFRKSTYQDQQDVPDVLAGFQPDMDPRLREVLEALDDDAYVDEEEDGDFFTSIAKDGEEVSLEDFEDNLYQDNNAEWLEGDDEGWESDRTIKANETNNQVPQLTTDQIQNSTDKTSSTITATSDDGDFMSKFRDLPSSIKKPIASGNPLPAGAVSVYSTTPSSLLSGMKRKKRKGAQTSTSSFSMTSSSIARTEGLQTLDARFDRVLESYAEEDEDAEYDDNTSLASGRSGMSKASGISRVSGMSGLSTASHRSAISELVNRTEFDSLMDEFLGEHEIKGKRRVRKGDGKTGMQELDEIRNTLGRRERMLAPSASTGVAS